jgi:hypothetical protein
MSVDPNKYSKNKDIKPETALSGILAALKMGLMILGLIGLAIELFKEDGWLKTLLAKLFESTTTMLFIPVIIFVLWLLNRIMSSNNKGEVNKSGDLPMYIMMAIGAYYLFSIVTTGGF